MKDGSDETHPNLVVHWKLKIALSVGLTLFFCVPYFALQRLTIFPVRRLPLSAIDELIAFAPAWVWVYQSVYLLLSIVPWLSSSATELNRYARGFVLLSCAGFLFFLFLPIQGPRPDGLAADPMFRLLVSYDAPLNSFPSLHVGLSVYTVLFASRLLPRRVIAWLWIWAAAIAFAAIATKQHYAVDLPAGALLAWGCHRWTSLIGAHRAAQVRHHNPGPSRTLVLDVERSAHAETIWPRGSGGPLDLLCDRRRSTATAVAQPARGSRSRVPAQAERNLRASDPRESN